MSFFLGFLTGIASAGLLLLIANWRTLAWKFTTIFR
jgi:hypothetical protein